jgi:four helix bundle protein
MGDGYEDLEVYQRAFAMQRPVYQLVVRFPDFEKYDLAQQMRKACKSITSNIVEGYGRRRSPKEFCSFLALSLASANEMENHLKTAHQLEYITGEELATFLKEYQIIGKQLTQ